MIVKPRNISGFADYSEAENAMLSNWISKIEKTYRLFGFSRLTPRPIELREVLLSKGGIQKQIFGISRLQNDAPTDLALPFDRTVPLAYWVAKHHNEITFPYKRYDISYSYRGERSQAGRFQGFFQADVDIIGNKTLDVNADSETIGVIYKTLINLGFDNIYICINELNLVDKILENLNISHKSKREILNIVDSIQKISEQEFIKEVISVTGFAPIIAEDFRNLFLFEGSISEYKKTLSIKKLINEPVAKYLNHAEETINYLRDIGIPNDNIIFRPAIVRGLDYYTGIVFETFVKGHENLGSVASGGRYDNLASTFTKAVLPGVGGSIGLTRLFDLALKNNLIVLKKNTEADVFVGYRINELKELSNNCAAQLRQLNINTDLYSGQGNFNKQLTYADKKGFEIAVFMMDKESILIKNLETGKQVEVNDIKDLINYFKDTP